MGKQLAMFLDQPASLWAKVIKHKYRPQRNVLDLQARPAASQAWRAVVSAREVLIKGLRWKVGDGAAIQFMNEPWVSSIPVKLCPDVNCYNEVDESLVKDFILPSRRWNQPRLTRLWVSVCSG